MIRIEQGGNFATPHQLPSFRTADLLSSSASTSASLSPASRSTATVSAPIGRAGAPNGAGSPSHNTVGRIDRIGPSCGCASSTTNPTARRCGSSVNVSSVWQIAAGTSAASNNSNHAAVSRPSSASRRRANQSAAWRKRSATERNLASPSNSGRAIAVRNPTHLRVRVGSDRHPSIGGAKRLVIRIQHARIARFSARRHERCRPEILLQHEGRHRLVHRHLNGAAFAGPLATEQRRQDRPGGDLPRHMIA